MATEDRKQAVETAEDTLADNRAAAVRVTKETLDPGTMEFSSVTILTRGAPESPRKTAIKESDRSPVCASPQDLYAPLARELIGRTLEDWLARQGATAFELLHRPDLAERLEASGMELQHAVQKVSVPESQASGQSVHDLIRHYQKLADQAIERLISAGKRRRAPDLETVPLAEAASSLLTSPDRPLLIGMSICRVLAECKGPRAKLETLMTLLDGAPAEGQPRALVLVAAEQLLCDLFASRKNIAQILGPSLDAGAGLAAIVRMAAPREVDAIVAHDARLAIQIPALDGPASRLGQRLQAGEFPLLAAALARMVLRELTSPRRLRPSDAAGEIDILRALASSLTAAAGRLLTLDEVQSAFVERSKSLVTADFVAAYLLTCRSVLEEAEALCRLCENVTGAANKRSAARWMHACVSSLRFESEMRQSQVSVTQKLQILAGLQKSVRASSLSETDEGQITAAIGLVGGTIEAEGRLTAQLARATLPLQQKLSALLRLAAGETAPLGPAAERAKAEVVRLLRAPDTRQALSRSPESLSALRGLMQAAGLAA